MNYKYEIYKEKHLKTFSFKQLILILTLIPVNKFLFSRYKLILFSHYNEILIKVNGTGKYSIINNDYPFKPGSYLLNDDPKPKEFLNSKIKFTKSENKVKLIFKNTIENCNSMFKGCSKITEIDLSNFKSSNKGNIDSMFRNCASLKKIVFGNFETSKLSNMNYIFYGCSSLETLDLSSFDTSKVTHFHYMFYNCNSLKYALMFIVFIVCLMDVLL